MTPMKTEQALSILGFYSCNRKLSEFYEDEHYAELKDAIHSVFNNFDYTSCADKTIFEIFREAFKMHVDNTENKISSNKEVSMSCETLIDACFVTEWDDGLIVEVPCKLNVTTGETTDIESSDECPDAGLVSQCVLYVNGEGERHFFEIDANRYENDNETFVEEGELDRIKNMFTPKEPFPFTL